MVKTKHQKSKPKKHPIHKKPGKPTDISQFRSQLDALGLQIVQVTADGNCFFRALADQLEGNEEEHTKYRSMVVQYILKNRDLFEPFVEDDVPFSAYCESMEKDGTWAGHLEVQAASLVTHSNLCIHRMLSPRWYVQNFDNQEARMIHLSYHNEEHYNSVRLKEDTCDGPAKSIIIKADAGPVATSLQSKARATNCHSKAGKCISNQGIIKSVMAGSGCENPQKVEQVLLQVSGDVDAAVEFLMADQSIEECGEQIESTLPNADSSAGVDEAENGQEQEDEVIVKNDKEKRPKNRDNQSGHENNSQLHSKNIPRNKVCPCGSKKKYKACCGSATGKSSSNAAVNQRMDDSKKSRKAGKRGGEPKATSVSDGSVPDMGSLCI